MQHDVCVHTCDGRVGRGTSTANRCLRKVGHVRVDLHEVIVTGEWRARAYVQKRSACATRGGEDNDDFKYMTKQGSVSNSHSNEGNIRVTIWQWHVQVLGK